MESIAERGIIAEDLRCEVLDETVVKVTSRSTPGGDISFPFRFGKPKLVDIQTIGKDILLGFITEEGSLYILFNWSRVRVRINSTHVPTRLFTLVFEDKCLSFGGSTKNLSISDSMDLLKIQPPTIEIDADFDIDKICKVYRKSVTPLYDFFHNRKDFGHIGDYLISEALFEDSYSPLAKIGDIGKGRMITIINLIKRFASISRNYGGMSLENKHGIGFISPLGKKGDFHNYMRVYNRVGANCLNCNSIIEEIRGICYCPGCQV